MSDPSGDELHFAVPGATPHYGPDRPVRTRRIDLELRPDLATKTIDAVCALSVEAVDDGVTSIELDSVDLDVSAAYALGDDGSRGAGLRYDARSLTLTVWFPQPMRAGERFRFAIAYRVVDPRRGAYFTEPDRARPQKPRQLWTQSQDSDARFWVPCQDSPEIKAATSATIVVPRGLFALSNGALVRRTDGDATSTFEYRQDVPHSPYLLTLVVGDFSEVEQPGGSVPVSYYVARGREAEGERSFGRTPEMMAVLEAFTGTPYPFARYSQIAVADFVMGGMENTTATTQTDDTLHDERAHLDFTSDYLVSHELAHQWFGDLLTTRDWSHAWLNEGFATYCEAVWWEAAFGWDEYGYFMFDLVARYLDEASSRYRRAIVDNVYCEHMELFDRHLYEKGAAVLHMLRGDLGDERFRRAVARYVRDNAGASVETLDLVRAIEAATGRNLRAFFDRWVFRAGHPDLEISYEWDRHRGAAILTVEQAQPAGEDDAPFVFDLTIGLCRTVAADRPRDLAQALPDERRVRLPIDARKHTFSIPFPAEPELVRIDPGAYVLGAVTFDLGTDMHVAILRHDPDVVARIRAARALARDGSRVAAAALETGLRDAFWGVAAETARALGETRAAWARDLLIAAAGHEHPKVRRAVAVALGEFAAPDDTGASTALRALLDDASYFVVGSALQSLGASRASGAREILERHLDVPSWHDVIAAGAAMGLGTLGDPAALPALAKASGDDRPPHLRRTALVALAKLAGTADGDHPSIRETVRRGLSDDLIVVQRGAIEAAQTMLDPRLQSELARLMSRPQKGGVQRDARDAYDAIERARRMPPELAKLRRDVEALRADVAELRTTLG